MSNSLFHNLRGVVKFDEPLSRHTSWRVGGLVDIFYTPADIDDLEIFLRQLPEDQPILWLGLGSNLLVRDKGFRGVVIATHKALSKLQVLENNRIYAQSGVACAKIARLSVKHALSGAEFFAGIPGTLGGALAMNAGAFGTETWDVVETADTIERDGNREHWPAERVVTGYREVKLPREMWFTGAVLRLSDTVADGREKIRGLLQKRANSQPIQSANAGSVFRNPENDFAAKLIENCGLKGQRVGGAIVSYQHANFIINEGHASASDIETLIELVQFSVLEQTGVQLVPEVRIVGEAG